MTIADRSKAALARGRAVLDEGNAGARLLHEEPLALAEREVRRGIAIRSSCSTSLRRVESETASSSCGAPSRSRHLSGKVVVVHRPSSLGTACCVVRCIERHLARPHDLVTPKRASTPVRRAGRTMSEGAAAGDSPGGSGGALVIELE